jgi:selenophosphate synthase
MDVFEKFRENLNKYKQMGLNPLSLATGCAVKVDLISVVYPALERIKPVLSKNNITILPREDADIFITREKMEIKRIINGGAFDGDRAISLIQVNQKTAGSIELFANFLLKVYSSIKTNRPLTIGKGHSIVTTNPNGEVAVLDIFKLDGRRLNSYTLANNDTIQIVDPMEEPGAQMQVDVAISNSLNDLFVKGVHTNLKIIPLIDAPNEELKSKLIKNYENYSKRYGIKIMHDIQPSVNTLMIGATVIGESDHELPVYYDKVNEDMEILVTRPMGELTPINVYMWILAVPELMELMENNGIQFNYLEKIKLKSLEYMSKPNLDIAKIIYSYLPEFGREFDPISHIAITSDITGPGIFVIKELAERANVDVELTEIPVIDERLCEFATENFIIPNSTIGTNGAIVIFAHKRTIDSIAEDIKRVGGEPIKIGKVLGKGNGNVFVSQKITKLIRKENILNKFKIKH